MKTKISKKIITSTIDDNEYLLNIETGKYIKLNTSAKFILDQLKKDCEYNDVIKLISENFDIPSEQASDDFYHFLNMAKTLKIIDENN